MDFIKKYLKAALLMELFLLSLFTPSLAQENRQRVLRVAFPQVRGITETANDGTRHGLVVDYLNEIAKYTGWEYEYIDVTDANEMLIAFDEGAYDLMGGQYYIAGLEKQYAYPEYNIGYSRSTLLARRNDRSIRANDLESLNGKTIGVYVNARENIRRLKEFLAINGLNCTLKEYGYTQLRDGSLYPYLENKEIDLLLGNAPDGNNALRVVASYNSQPYYIVTTPGNEEILNGLNRALERITDANPNFATERYEANLPDLAVDIMLNAQEVGYVQSKGTVRVAVPVGYQPLFSQGAADAVPTGLAPDMLQQVATFTGLKFLYLQADTYNEAIRLVQTGKADILGFFLDSEDVAAQQRLALTAAYGSMNNILVRNKASSYPGENLIGAIVEGRPLPNSIAAARVYSYTDLTDALFKVNRGDMDFVYGLSTRLEQAIQQNYFTNLVPVSLAGEVSQIAFALARPVDPDLLTILNKAINSLSLEERSALLNRNLIAIGTAQLSLAALIYANPLAFVAVLAFILLVIVALILYVARSRVRAALIQSNLDRVQAESRAKGDFLSRMSHEIRTPMNAVVGLADLTCMAEDVPEGIRDNLNKLRSSAQYLLSLINDILDMSRLESGMLSIASEPFSLEQILNGLKGMLDAEADRRGLCFTVTKRIAHIDLQGDAVRLRQVLINLLNNAFKFTPEGGSVRLQVTERDAGETQAAYTFQVVDSGVGIRAEDQQRVFGTFEQVGASSSQSQGTGLGLAISRSIVKLMGGELSLESTPGKGSAFYFTVTLAYATAQPRRDESAPGDDRLDGVQIMLVEDNDLNAEIAQKLLEIRGARVQRCENGKLALERFAASQMGEFHLILMDVQMPVMNGLDAARAIRALPRIDASTIPIVAMTANSFKKDMDAAMQAGMNAFIAKPLDVNCLYRILRSVLG